MSRTAFGLLAWVLLILALGTSSPSVAADPSTKVLQSLAEGNQRFVAGTPQPTVAVSKRRLDLAMGQKPGAIILSCSDSRVPPELIFDHGLGDLFTVRVAGNVLNSDSSASIEYAVENLGSSLIVIMGHESCGAVKAAVSRKKGESAGSPDLDSLVGSIQKNLGITGSDAHSYAAAQDKKLRKAAMTNVDAVADQLVSRSAIIAKAVKSGKVKIVRAIYNIETGAVDFWNPNDLASKLAQGMCLCRGHACELY